MSKHDQFLRKLDEDRLRRERVTAPVYRAALPPEIATQLSDDDLQNLSLDSLVSAQGARTARRRKKAPRG